VVPQDWANPETIQSFMPIETSEALYPGANSIAIDTSGDLALVGGTDGTAGLYSISQKKLVQVLNGDSGAIIDTIWWGNRAVFSTSSGRVKIFDINGTEVATFNSHAGKVTALALHPSGEILASVGVDKSYVLYDLSSLKPVSQVFTDSGIYDVHD
jgi:pre-mRNA-processing factor 19